MALMSVAEPQTTTLLGLFLVAGGFLIFALFSRTWDLRHIPGPLGARLTNFWLAGNYWKGELFTDIALDLQQKYGSVVRYGPRRVLFSDLSAVGVIFNTKKPFVKVRPHTSQWRFQL